MKWSRGTRNCSTMASNSSALTRRAPVSIAETVCRSSTPRTSANSFCERIARGEGVECRFFHQTRRISLTSRRDCQIA